MSTYNVNELKLKKMLHNCLLTCRTTRDIDNGRDPEYWREADFDVLTDSDRAYFRENFAANNSLGGLSKERLDEIRGSDFNWKVHAKLDANEKEDEETNEEQDPDQDGQGDKVVGVDNKKRFSRGSREEEASEEEGFPFFDEGFDNIVTYKGDGEADFPMRWSESRLYAYHPESKREPMPFYPQNRKNPHPLILEFYSRWLYVSGLPPAMSESGMKLARATTLTALQEQELQKTVTRLFGVSTDQVYPANETSAFIGFETPEGREQVARSGPNAKILPRAVTISLYSPSDDEDDNASEFMKEIDPKTVLKLENVPPHRFTRETLARDLFPAGSELEAAYPISKEDVWFLSPTTALIRLESTEQVDSSLSSTQVAARLEEVGQYPVRLFHARRNILHDRMEDAYSEIRKQGHRLVVDGDMPSKNFYISHAGVVMLRNLDRESVTRESISDFFQPYSSMFRDVIGSVEFATCNDGLPTDRAYVGFERLGEAEAAVEALKGCAQIGDNVVFLKLVKDRMIPCTPPRRVRPERSEEEILINLSDWEQYVDPEDLKYLEEHGVARVVMDEALRGLRFHNRSFGALDWAMKEEKLEPDKESGDDYREAVRMYVATLKECLGTPEKPGVVYESMHFPGEPIDLSIFETDKQRVRKLLKKREA